MSASLQKNCCAAQDRRDRPVFAYRTATQWTPVKDLPCDNRTDRRCRSEPSAFSRTKAAAVLRTLSAPTCSLRVGCSAYPLGILTVAFGMVLRPLPHHSPHRRRNVRCRHLSPAVDGEAARAINCGLSPQRRHACLPELGSRTAAAFGCIARVMIVNRRHYPLNPTARICKRPAFARRGRRCRILR
jgi:hypothetical protein